jgi:hypothetical protein
MIQAGLDPFTIKTLMGQFKNLSGAQRVQILKVLGESTCNFCINLKIFQNKNQDERLSRKSVAKVSGHICWEEEREREERERETHIDMYFW